jgi:hypothetical protein
MRKRAKVLTRMIGFNPASTSPGNGRARLDSDLRALLPCLAANLHHEWKITIADNGSPDITSGVASKLIQEHLHAFTLLFAEVQRARAYRRVPLVRDAGVLSYMDIDFSSDRTVTTNLKDAITGRDSMLPCLPLRRLLFAEGRQWSGILGSTLHPREKGTRARQTDERCIRRSPLLKGNQHGS